MGHLIRHIFEISGAFTALQERDEQEDEEQHDDGTDRSESDERPLPARLVIAEMLEALEEQRADDTEDR